MANLSLCDIPEDLYQQIKAIAERNRCSINQQIIVLLEQAVRQQQPPSIAVLERIDQQRNGIAASVGVMHDSAEQIAEDRDR